MLSLLPSGRWTGAYGGPVPGQRRIRIDHVQLMHTARVQVSHRYGRVLRDLLLHAECRLRRVRHVQIARYRIAGGRIGRQPLQLRRSWDCRIEVGVGNGVCLLRDAVETLGGQQSSRTRSDRRRCHSRRVEPSSAACCDRAPTRGSIAAPSCLRRVCRSGFRTASRS